MTHRSVVWRTRRSNASGHPRFPSSTLALLASDSYGGLWFGDSSGLCHWLPTSASADCDLQRLLKPLAGLQGVSAILIPEDGALAVGRHCATGRRIRSGAPATGRARAHRSGRLQQQYAACSVAIAGSARRTVGRDVRAGHLPALRKATSSTLVQRRGYPVMR